MRQVLAAVTALMMMGAAPLQAADCRPDKTEVVASVKVAAFQDRVFFRLSALALDFDGSPVAYGARDQGQENICVGITTNSGECRGRSGGTTASGLRCTQVCQQVFSAWVKAGSNLATLGNTMCSVGLGGGGCSKPQVRLQDPPHSDFFVSETSLKVGPDTGAPPKGWAAQQAAQIDPEAVNYIVAPTALAKFGVSYGDVGLAYAASSQTPAPFIVGDCCGLGEGSVALLKALKPGDPPRLTSDISAMGAPVQRYKSGISGDFRFVIFPHTRKLVAEAGAMTVGPASGLQDWIAQQAGNAAGRTSREEIMACTKH
jgi:hypothetical protein